LSLAGEEVRQIRTQRRDPVVTCFNQIGQCCAFGTGGVVPLFKGTVTEGLRGFGSIGGQTKEDCAIVRHLLKVKTDLGEIL
jgi:hypothetical protein